MHDGRTVSLIGEYNNTPAMENVLLFLFYLAVPALVIWISEKFRILRKIGPVLILYIIGIIVGNSGLLSSQSDALRDTIISVVIPLAIPLMLFSCNFREWNIRSALITLLTGIFSVTISIVAGYFIFSPLVNDSLFGANMEKIAGLLSGVYTGGTPNLAALKLMLDVPNEIYIVVHSYDMLVSLLYLTFLLGVGIKLFRKYLNKGAIQQEVTQIEEETEINPYGKFRDFLFLKRLSFAIALAALIFGLSGVISLLADKKYQIVVVILLITTLSILASFSKRVRNIEGSYDSGMYLVYIFSVVVASMANLSKLDLAGGIFVLIYIIFAIFVSLFLQVFLSRFFKLDADTVVVSSVALINSPPFVPLIASAMNNKSVIITGLTVGLAGYAIGNYLGFIITGLLTYL